MKDHKVLLDFSSIMSGGFPFSGIPQDTRVIFNTLSQTDRIKPVGLICSTNNKSIGLNFQKHTNPIQQALAYTHYFIHLGDQGQGNQTQSLFTLKQARKLIALLPRLIKKEYDLHLMDKAYSDYVWRRAFDGFLENAARENILTEEFVLTNCSRFVQNIKIYFGLSRDEIKTTPYDFAIFQSSAPYDIKVSQNTIPIVRFHDAVPIRFPDTIAHGRYSKLFAKSLTQGAKKAVFVCNSEPVREDLLSLAPQLEKRVHVIPPGLSIAKTVFEKNQKIVRNIIKTRRSGLLKAKYAIELAEIPAETDFSNYIIAVSTMEPRKNFLSLIRAWEKIRYQHHDQLKLVIVGSEGWRADSVIQAMKPHIIAGDLIHLEKVPVFELGTLYANARAFVFPTYYEGFGIPFIEALQAGCPLIVSDIPSARWVLEDAALYCNPYDIDSIASAMDKLLYSEQGPSLIHDLTVKGQRIIQKYSAETLGQQWLALFDLLKSNA